MFGRMHWWWLVLGMVLLGVVVTAVIIFTKDQPPYQKAIYKQQSVSEELTSDTAAPITAANETYVRAWSADTLCSFNGEDGPSPHKNEGLRFPEVLYGLFLRFAACYTFLCGSGCATEGPWSQAFVQARECHRHVPSRHRVSG
jgi:hypothetical protein